MVSFLFFLNAKCFKAISVKVKINLNKFCVYKKVKFSNQIMEILNFSLNKNRLVSHVRTIYRLWNSLAHKINWNISRQR